MLTISLDGFPHSLVEHSVIRSAMPFFFDLAGAQSRRMSSVHPAVSSVAWASFMTGRNPGEHGIFGFIERNLATFELTIPTAGRVRSPVLWPELNRYGIPVLVMNVPMTYPPVVVDGVLVGCFLCTDVSKVAFPPDVSVFLKSAGYIIDVDAGASKRKIPREFIDSIISVLDKRCESFITLMNERHWRYAHLHIMETDRLFHFHFNAVMDENHLLHSEIVRFFKRLDYWIERLHEELTASDELLVLSDHGFERSCMEVQINTWLAKNRWLKWNADGGSGLGMLDSATSAYSLIPGRIYFNRKGREPNGKLNDADCVNLGDEIKEALLELQNPETTQKLIREVYFRDEIFKGGALDMAPDMVAVPESGVELKGKLQPAPLLARSSMEGTHTQDDAMIWSETGEFITQTPCITDLFASILSFFTIEATSQEPAAFTFSMDG